jgi:hypothetical protein
MNVDGFSDEERKNCARFGCHACGVKLRHAAGGSGRIRPAHGSLRLAEPPWRQRQPRGPPTAPGGCGSRFSARSFLLGSFLMSKYDRKT